MRITALMTTRRFGTPPRMAMLALLLASLALIVYPGAVPTAQAQEGLEPGATSSDSPLRYLGDLPMPAHADSFGLAGIDAANERLYATYVDREEFASHLVAYDLSTDIPQPIGDKAVLSEFPDQNDLSGGRPDGSVGIDSERDRLFFLERGGDGNPEIFVFDTEALEHVNTYQFASSLPGFQPLGMTYSPADDRFYVVGEMSGSRAVTLVTGLFGYVAGPAVTVVALDGKTVRSSQAGPAAWIRPVPECRLRPQDSNNNGALIARSRLRSALYFPCTAGALAGVQAPGQSGVVRIGIGGDDSQADVGGFDVDFFPISGTYVLGNASTTGVAGFDPATDRVFLQSLASAAPGTWVFDGRLETYAGFIGAPNSTNTLLAVNHHSGRYYMGLRGDLDDEAGILIADGRATPVPQGTFDDRFAPEGRLVADPTADRLFFSYGGSNEKFAIVRDEPVPVPPADEFDPDSLTADVPEGPDTTANLTGTSGGFGAAFTLVGGVESAVASSDVISLLRGYADVDQLPDDAVNPLEFSFGDRGVEAGSVTDATLTGFGATAGAQAAGLDNATDSDRANRQNELRERFGDGSDSEDGSGEGSNEPSDDADEPACDPGSDPACLLDWPHQQVECSDGGEGRQEAGAEGENGFGEASVTCDLAAEQTSASALYQGEAGATGLTVASSSFDTDLRRDAELGTVAKTVARADGVRLPTIDGGVAVEIGSVTARSRTLAHGQTGTSAARWVRTIDGVRVLGSSGDVLYPRPGEEDPTSCVTVIDSASGDEPQRTGSCQALVDGLNEILPDDKMKLRLPIPEVTASPKGALGQVRESDRDFLRGQTLYNDSSRDLPALEAVVYKDGRERSRLLVELASIRSTSIYIIQRFTSFGPPPQDGSRFDVPGSLGDIGTDVGVPSTDLGGDPGFGQEEQQRLVDELAAFLSNVNPNALAGGQQTDGAPPVDDRFDDGQAEPPATDSGVDQGLAAGPSVDVGEPPTLSQDVGGGQAPQPEVALDAPASQVAPPPQAQAGQERSLGNRFLSRSAGDAAAVGGIWLLFLGALATTLRRTSLLQLSAHR